jgi:hypothetical protein
MANQESHYGKQNVIKFPTKGIPSDYCPNSPDTEHVYIQQEYEPEIKSCLWCGLLIVPESSQGSS